MTFLSFCMYNMEKSDGGFMVINCMTDIHMHIIPDVDDGPVDLNMALSMLDLARQEEIRAIFATSHSSAYDNYALKSRQGFSNLKDLAARFLPQMDIYLGCEVYCDESWLDETVKKLSSGVYPTMNGTHYVLIEFSTWVRRQAALNCVERILKAGYTPIIAHMERYFYLRFDRELVSALRKMGALIQVNAYSAYEESEDEVREWARWILRNKMVDFLGTDAHRTGHRPPNALTGLRWMAENLEEEYFRAICSGNAKKYLKI